MRNKTAFSIIGILLAGITCAELFGPDKVAKVITINLAFTTLVTGSVMFIAITVGFVRGMLINSREYKTGKGYEAYKGYISRVAVGEEAIVFGSGYVVISNKLYSRLLNSANKGMISSDEAIQNLFLHVNNDIKPYNF